MALNKIERRLLTEARARIVECRSEFICLALMDAKTRFSGLDRQNTPLYQQGYERLTQYIRGQLVYQGKWHGTLGCWQKKARRDLLFNKERLRQDRIAWIDWMLEKK